jgi:hypothetical protein
LLGILEPLGNSHPKNEASEGVNLGGANHHEKGYRQINVFVRIIFDR